MDFPLRKLRDLILSLAQGFAHFKQSVISVEWMNKRINRNCTDRAVLNWYVCLLPHFTRICLPSSQMQIWSYDSLNFFFPWFPDSFRNHKEALNLNLEVCFPKTAWCFEETEVECPYTGEYSLVSPQEPSSPWRWVDSPSTLPWSKLLGVVY